MKYHYKPTYKDYDPEGLREIERTPIQTEADELNWPLFMPVLMLVVLAFLAIGAMTGIYYLVRWLQ